MELKGIIIKHFGQCGACSIPLASTDSVSLLAKAITDSISDLVEVCKSCYGTGRISGSTNAPNCEYCKGYGMLLKGRNI